MSGTTDQESWSAPSQMGAGVKDQADGGVKDQADGGVGGLIALSLDGKESSVGQDYKGEDYDDKEEEDGGTSTGWGDSMEEEKEEAIGESGEWTEVVSRREQKLSAARPSDNSEEQNASEGGENQLQQDVPISAVMEVGQGQRRRRCTEDGEDQERESKCSRVGLSRLPILQDFDPVQDWGKGREDEGDIEGDFGMEGGKGRGEKEGRVGDHKNVVLEENQGRG
ncbi:hypothetical protein G5714_023070 [Onychostoma macrolepis]|uniref:Uncharacterized protein n=1 Tax=Onychostoma macrolepis TaxID=369639 RepID=A0A7J6BQR2_9TELE|nr:hypothetical protein G5714_023070 [Onychostoma macrolepis]